MATRPAWGGTIPLVPIGSFRDTIKRSRAGKSLKIWFVPLTSQALRVALNTAVGRKTTAALTVWVAARLGIKAPSQALMGADIERWIIIQKFAYRTAVKQRDTVRMRTIEELMDAPSAPGPKSPFPLGYFKRIDPGPVPKTALQPAPNPDIDDPGQNRRKRKKEDFLPWLERRYRDRRRNRFTNLPPKRQGRRRT